MFRLARVLRNEQSNIFHLQTRHPWRWNVHPWTLVGSKYHFVRFLLSLFSDVEFRYLLKNVWWNLYRRCERSEAIQLCLPFPGLRCRSRAPRKDGIRLYPKFCRRYELRYKLAIKLIVFISIIFGMNISVYADDKTTPEKKTVKVYTVTTTEIYDTYKYPVTVEPRHERGMYSEITGFVHNIYVNVGAFVKKDEILLQLKPTEVGRTEQPFIIKSPMDGQITNVAKKIGSHVKPGELLIHIVDPSDLTIKIEIPEAELTLLQVKQQGEAKFRAVVEAIPVIVTGVSSLIDQTTGTATGQLDWDNQNFKADELNLIKKQIYPGMLGVVTFKLNQRMAIKIPSKSILHEKEVEKVRLVKDGKVTRNIVKIGKHFDGGFVEINDGLNVGDVVVVTTGKYIKENEEVVIEKEQK